MSVDGDLVLLTSEFPFGNKAETFLEAEIEVLSKRFDRVFVLPSHRRPGLRPVPGNVTLVQMPWLDVPGLREKRRSLISSAAFEVALTTARAPSNWLPYLRSARMYLDILAQNVEKSRQLRTFIRDHDLSRAIFYDYWFENSTVALALLRRAGVISTAVCRAHGFDVYDERWAGRPVPFREFKSSGLDAVFPVSEFGRKYLQERWPPLATKLRVARLGAPVRPPPATEPGEIPLVVTCGSLIPSKRVHLVPRVLAEMNRPLEWVHIGDGPERPSVEAAAAGLPARVSWDLLGHIDNAAVAAFYRSRHVAALVSLSLSEGLPVSMMEAMSWGIPVVAIGVHGVPEIVNTETGVLLDEHATLTQIGTGLAQALDPDRFDRGRVRRFFEEHYDASTNYNAFVDVLVALHDEQGGPVR